MKKSLVTLLLLAVIGGFGYAYFKYKDTGPKFTVTTLQITRGDIVDTVGATGTLQAVTTVQVGTQVSGTIQHLYADFNSLVKKGQVLARLDPSLFADPDRSGQGEPAAVRRPTSSGCKVALDDANQKLTRARELSGRQADSAERSRQPPKWPCDRLKRSFAPRKPRSPRRRRR